MRVVVVGAGEIFEHAHLPTYMSLGIPIAGIFDQDPARAEQLAVRVSAQAVETLDELLALEANAIDIAVPPGVQPAIIEAALVAGLHVHAQKPLALNREVAFDLVGAAKRANRYLVVSQQMRWEVMIARLRHALATGLLGAVKELKFDLRLPMRFKLRPHWYADEPRGVVLLNSIHLLDACRFLLGEPDSLTASTRHDDRYDVAGETEAHIELSFASGARAVIDDVRVPVSSPTVATLSLEAERGSFSGTFGLWTRYPKPTPDRGTLTLASGVSDEVVGCVIPDAFAGPIGELRAAIDHGIEPTVDGADHLRTLALVEAVYHSASSGARTVSPKRLGS